MMNTTRPVLRLLVLLFSAVGVAAAGTPPAAPGVTGDLRVHADFPSKFVAAREVDVWLPPSYAGDPARRYPVVYLHDGQNLFDPRLAMNHTDWGVDEAMTRLIAAGAVREAIVVGVWNTPKRRQEYLPQKAVEWARGTTHEAPLQQSLTQRGTPPEEQIWLADAYLRFFVAELKPFIDREYRTRPGRADTAIMGSSLGGLISLYAISEYPEIFGGAGCVSTHWPVGNGLVVDYMRGRLPDPTTHRIYFDFGTETLDRDYEPYQRLMDTQMTERGYVRGTNWETRRFPGAAHTESAWRDRVEIPLRFLLAEGPRDAELR